MFVCNTGYGYIRDLQSGKIVAKAELKGSHPIKTGFEFIEVANKTELDAVKIDKEPQTQDQINESLIRSKQTEILRRMAIAELQSEGKL